MGLTICITGYLDATLREGLPKRISETGATYSADLYKTATHLLAKETKGDKHKWVHISNLLFDGKDIDTALSSRALTTLQAMESRCLA